MIVIPKDLIKKGFFMKQYTGTRQCGDGSEGLSWKKCKCGNDLCIDVGDCIRDGEFEWFASMHCNKCGEAMEMDGRGIFDLPCEIQQEIINQDGERGLYS